MSASAPPSRVLHRHQLRRRGCPTVVEANVRAVVSALRPEPCPCRSGLRLRRPRRVVGNRQRSGQRTPAAGLNSTETGTLRPPPATSRSGCRLDERVADVPVISPMSASAPPSQSSSPSPTAPRRRSTVVEANVKLSASALRPEPCPCRSGLPPAASRRVVDNRQRSGQTYPPPRLDSTETVHVAPPPATSRRWLLT